MYAGVCGGGLHSSRHGMTALPVAIIHWLRYASPYPHIRSRPSRMTTRRQGRRNIISLRWINLPIGGSCVFGMMAISHQRACLMVYDTWLAQHDQVPLWWCSIDLSSCIDVTSYVWMYVWAIHVYILINTSCHCRTRCIHCKLEPILCRSISLCCKEWFELHFAGFERPLEVLQGIQMRIHGSVEIWCVFIFCEMGEARGEVFNRGGGGMLPHPSGEIFLHAYTHKIPVEYV